MSILETIAFAFGKKKRDVLCDFASLARAIADDAKIDQARALEILEKSNRTPDDLTAAVARIKDRRELARLVQLAAPVAGRRKARELKSAQLERNLVEAARQHDVGLHPLLIEEAEDARIEAAAQRAAELLRKTADPDQAGAAGDAARTRAGIDRRLDTLIQRKKDALEVIKNTKETLKHNQTNFGSPPHPADVAEMQGRIVNAEASTVEIDQQIALAKRELADATKHAVEVEDALMIV